MCTRCPGLLARTVDRRRLLLGLATVATAPALSGCERIASALVPSSEIERLGLEAWARLKAEVPPSPDGAAQRTARTIADRLLRADGDDPARWEVLVFASPEINAFVLPGRKIGIFEGLVATAGSADELAAVIGHEIGHLAANHAEERVVAGVAQDLGVRLVALALDWGDVPFGREVAAAFGMGVEFGLARPYGRGQELEADRLGLFTMARAGYDPRAAIRFWERMDRLSRGGLPALLSTHPAPGTRIEEIREIVPEALAARPAAAPNAR
jgi:predicted Zn-dependent protease